MICRYMVVCRVMDRASCMSGTSLHVYLFFLLFHSNHLSPLVLSLSCSASSRMLSPPILTLLHSLALNSIPHFASVTKSYLYRNEVFNIFFSSFIMSLASSVNNHTRLFVAYQLCTSGTLLVPNCVDRLEKNTTKFVTHDLYSFF